MWPSPEPAPLARVQAILNPRAGGGRAARAWPELRAVLEASGLAWSLSESAGPGDARLLAAGFAGAGPDTLVLAIGGDGTVHEVVNGLLGAPNPVAWGAEGVPAAPGPGAGQGLLPALGIVPAGSGNDFVKQLGLPRAPAEALRVVLRAPERRVDLGRVNDRWFVNGVGWGLDGQVALTVAQRRRPGERGRYLLALGPALRRHRPAHVDLEVDGRTVPGYVTLVALTNGPCHGGGFWICPHARLDDGLLDLCVADAMPRWRILALLPRVLAGRHLGHPRVWFARGRRIRLVAREPRPAHADGELLGEALSRLEAEIWPGGLRLRAPGPQAEAGTGA